MDDKSSHGTKREDSLLTKLTGTAEDVYPKVKVGRKRYLGEETGEEVQTYSGERMLGPAGHEKNDKGRGMSVDEEQCKQKALQVLEEMKIFYSGTVTAWRDALRECDCMFNKSPAGGGDQRLPSTTNSFSGNFQSVLEDMEKIMQKLSTIITKLDAEFLQEFVQINPSVDAACQETSDLETAVQLQDGNSHLSVSDPHESESSEKERGTGPSPDTEQTTDFTVRSSDCNYVDETGEEKGVKVQVSEDEDCVSQTSHKNLLKETERDAERTSVKVKEEKKSEWVTVGLTGKMEDGESHVPDACFIRAPVGAAGDLSCEMADPCSCLMVTSSEELVSRVIRVTVQGRAKFPFPVTVVVPFCARYRGNYRDIAVKIIDGERRVSYVTPVATEGIYGGQRGSFAEVRVYALGLFAVVSCLKKENYTIPRRGLSLKLSMDPRVCLNYLPGAFTAPVMAQTMIQPIEAILLASVKSRCDVFHSVVSTSPLLYLTHPTSRPMRRPLTVTLPCPPNPEKKRGMMGQGKHTEPHHAGPVAPSWDQPASPRVRILGASLTSVKDMSNETLIVLGSRDKQWSVLEQVTVRNQQSGLVSFELTENFDRLLVVRLLSPLQPCHLISLAEELEESVGCQVVIVVLQRRQDDPHAAWVAVLPSRDLSWELNKLRARGNGGLLETSSDISMCEGDQLLLQFSGNITSTRSRDNHDDAPLERITFHAQRMNHLLVHLTEVDPFGNYSSPNYKGTALFYKVTRGELEWRGDKAVPKDVKLLGEPVCTLPLTLPKRVRSMNRPITARVKLCEETDSLSDSLLLWLAGELSQEDVVVLVSSLRLRRSAAQLVRLRDGDSVSMQAFHLLAMWRRGQPANPHQPKASHLAQCLAKSGRPDLARELLLRQAAATRKQAH